MHCQVIAWSFQRHLEIKYHQPQHPAVKGKDLVTLWYQRSTVTMTACHQRCSAGARQECRVLIPWNLTKGAKGNRASCAQCSEDNHSHSNHLPVPASQHTAAKEDLSQPQPALFSTQLEKKLGYQVYARTKRYLLNQNSFKMQDIIKECFDLDSCSANVFLSETSHWFYQHSLFNIQVTCRHTQE